MPDEIDNPPAFPLPLATALDGSIYNSAEQSGYSGGRSLRDYFAAHASDAGLKVMIDSYMNCNGHEREWRGPCWSDYHARQLAMVEARYRVAFADEMMSMLAARQTPTPKASEA